ncbi:MAG: hypothetical protein NT076_04190 [Candidatus Pacearchaeota archaeon]|nr:hypothetical protein [Candidatus Pacearchaeota archaeon]
MPGELNLEAVSTPENALVYLGLTRKRTGKGLYFSEEGMSRLGADFGLLPGLLTKIAKAWLKKIPPKEAAFRIVVTAEILSKSKVPKRLLHLLSEAARNKELTPLPLTDFETSPEILMCYLKEGVYKDRKRIGEELGDYLSGVYNRCIYSKCSKKIPENSKSKKYCSIECQEAESAQKANSSTILAEYSNLQSKVRTCSACHVPFWSRNFGKTRCDTCLEKEVERDDIFRPHRYSGPTQPD